MTETRFLDSTQLNRRNNAIARRDALRSKLRSTGWLSTTEQARLRNAEILLAREFGIWK